MKTIPKITVPTIFLALLIIAGQLVPEAHAVFGVRRRTAVVAASAGAAAGSASAAASQQQAAAAQQQAAAAQQQATVANQEAAAAKQQAAVAEQQAAAAQQEAAAARAAGRVPVGTVVPALPQGCTSVTVNGKNYSDCGGSFYQAAFQGNNLVYVVVQNPMP